MIRTCTKCKVEKNADEFYRRVGTRSGYKSWCKVCEGDRTDKYRRSHPEVYRSASKRFVARHPERRRRSQRKQSLKRFGLTAAMFDEMLDAQCGFCAICGRAIGEWHNKAVDHCHRTGKVRSILCGQCNTGLGRFCDSPAKLLAAVEYLLYHEAT